MKYHPCFFVVGVPRSGTTLLQRMIDNHPEAAVANDTHFIPRALENTDTELVHKGTAGEWIPLTPDLVQATRDYHRFYRMGLDAQQVDRAAASSFTYQQFVSMLYLARASKKRKAISGEKTPDYVRRLPLLSGLFPEAKILHIVRDGRDVALSLIQWATPTKGPGRIKLWEVEPIAVCALWWKWLVMAGRNGGRDYPARQYFELTYDGLVRDPLHSMEKVSEFLELSFSEKMLNYHEGRSCPTSGLSAKSAWLPPQSGLRDWRLEMPDSSVELFEALAGDALSAFGFARSFDKVTPAVAKKAKHYSTWWSENFLSRNSHGNLCESASVMTNASTK